MKSPKNGPFSVGPKIAPHNILNTTNYEKKPWFFRYCVSRTIGPIPLFLLEFIHIDNASLMFH